MSALMNKQGLCSGISSRQQQVAAVPRASRVQARAGLITPGGGDLSKPKGWDRPWIQANGSQPLLAPRTADMQGDPFGLLLRQRIVFMGGEVEDFSADAIISQLLLLDSQDPTKDIKIFINSPGGWSLDGCRSWGRVCACLPMGRAGARSGTHPCCDGGRCCSQLSHCHCWYE